MPLETSWPNDLSNACVLDTSTATLELAPLDGRVGALVVGDCVGSALGANEGLADEGSLVGRAVGAREGMSVGTIDGASEGACDCVGTRVPTTDGAVVGEADEGAKLGDGAGAKVAEPMRTINEVALTKPKALFATAA